MPKLPIISGKEMIKVLLELGYEHIRTRGSHFILVRFDKEKGKKTIPVPFHKELAKGTLKNIMKQAGINLENLLELL